MHSIHLYSRVHTRIHTLNEDRGRCMYEVSLSIGLHRQKMYIYICLLTIILTLMVPIRNSIVTRKWGIRVCCNGTNHRLPILPFTNKPISNMQVLYVYVYIWILYSICRFVDEWRDENALDWMCKCIVYAHVVPVHITYTISHVFILCLDGWMMLRPHRQLFFILLLQKL